jgi:O-antigen/teichoic acid export membrane protein
MDFAKKVVNTSVANLVARTLVLVGSIVLARVLGPKGLGEYAMLRAVPLLIVALVSIGLPSAAVYFLSREPQRQPQIVANLFLYSIVVGGVVAGGLWLSSPLLEQFYFRQSLKVSYLILLSLSVPLLLFIRFGSAILQGLYRIEERNVVQVLIRALLIPAYLILVWAAGWGITGALTGWVMAHCVVSVYVLFKVRKDVKFRWRPSFKGMQDIFRYGRTAYLGQLFDQVQNQIVVVVLGLFLESSRLGVFVVAMAFNGLVLLPSAAIRRPMLPRLSRMDPTSAARAFVQVSQVGFVLTLLLAIVMSVVAPYAVPLLYGSLFEEVARLLFVLLPGFVGSAVVSIVNVYFMSIGSPIRRVYLNIFRTSLLLIALGIGVKYGNLTGAAIGMTTALLLTLALSIFLACWRNPYVRFRDMMTVQSSVLAYARSLVHRK